MLQSNTSEKIIINKLTDILSQINNNKLSIKDAEWLLTAISYNNTIIITPNENIDNILSNIYQAINVNGITIQTPTSKDQSLQVLADYTQFFIKGKNLL